MLFTFVFRLLLDLYIKLLKQVAKHLNYLCYHKHSKLTYDWQKQSALLNFLLHLNLYYKQSFGL